MRVFFTIGTTKEIMHCILLQRMDIIDPAYPRFCIADAMGTQMVQGIFLGSLIDLRILSFCFIIIIFCLN